MFAWRTIGGDGAFRHALTDALDRAGLAAFVERVHIRAMFRPAASADDYLARAASAPRALIR